MKIWSGRSDFGSGHRINHSAASHRVRVIYIYIYIYNYCSISSCRIIYSVAASKRGSHLRNGTRLTFALITHLSTYGSARHCRPNTPSQNPLIWYRRHSRGPRRRRRIPLVQRPHPFLHISEWIQIRAVWPQLA